MTKVKTLIRCHVEFLSKIEANPLILTTAQAISNSNVTLHSCWGWKFRFILPSYDGTPQIQIESLRQPTKPHDIARQQSKWSRGDVACKFSCLRGGNCCRMTIEIILFHISISLDFPPHYCALRPKDRIQKRLTYNNHIQPLPSRLTLRHQESQNRSHPLLQCSHNGPPPQIRPIAGK